MKHLDPWFMQRLSSFGRRSAVMHHSHTFSFEDIHSRILRWRAVLIEAGIGPGDTVGLSGEFSCDYCALFFALSLNRNITVLTHRQHSASDQEMCKSFQIQHRVVLDQDGTRVVQHFPVNVEHKLYLELRNTGNPGLVLFSSGSGGRPKAIVHDLARFMEQYRQSGKQLRTIAFLGADHIGGINTMLYTLLHGGTMVIPASRTPDSVCSAIEQHKAELLPATPTFLRLLILSEAYSRYDISSLSMISYGTEPMPDSVLQKLSELFPNVRLKQTYGMSEFGIISSRSPDSTSRCVALGGKGVKTKIIDNILWVKAPTAMLGYLNDKAVIENGWLCTGDYVTEENGYLVIKGRARDVINVGGEKVHPIEVENVLLEMPEIEDAIVYGEPNALTGQVVAARIKPTDPEATAGDLKRAISSFCKGRLSQYKVPLRVELSSNDLITCRLKKKRSRIPL